MTSNVGHCDDEDKNSKCEDDEEDYETFSNKIQPEDKDPILSVSIFICGNSGAKAYRNYFAYLSGHLIVRL